MNRAKTVLITGATSGIGLQLAKLYNRKGFHLFLTGRRPLRTLPETIFNKNNYCEIELTNPNISKKLKSFLVSSGCSELDILIHNAGVGWFGKIEEQAQDSIEEIINVNTKVPIAISNSLLPMIEQTNGKIIFVSSITANLPCKEFAAYAASKSAINGFARSLQVELKDKVEVILVEPGGTKTEMHRKAGIPSKNLKENSFHSAEEVAKAIEFAEIKNKKRSTIGYKNQLVSLVGRKLPGLISTLAK